MDSQTMMPTDLNQRASEEIAMLQKNVQKKQMDAMMPDKIGSEQIRKADEILRKYKAGKSRLEQKIIANEQFWKLRQWNYMSSEISKSDFTPATAWLWSCIQARYSDVMDSYPTCNFRPRQEDDKEEALKLTNIVPVILEQNRYDDVYSDIAWYTLKHGGSVQGVFWNPEKNNGLGDVEIKKIDFINLFWEPGITDIQKSQHLFNTELMDNNIINQRWPQTVGKLGGSKVSLAHYLYDDQVDTTDKSVVIDWYYHTEYGGKKVLQYCKYVNDIVLYATENMTSRPEETTVDPQTGIPMVMETGPSMAERGFYDHGLYPFVVMSLYPIEGSICGYGLTDIGRDTQIQIDKLNRAIMRNSILTATPRHFIKNDGSINEEEYNDAEAELIHVEGSVDETNIRRIETQALPTFTIQMLQQKIDEVKYITSNQDANNGVHPSGVTAASAIAALQESAGKNARSSNKNFHRAYRDVCYQIVELIRQFYDMPRTFRIIPDAMLGPQFVTYDNSGLVPQQQFNMLGEEMGLRKPEFDIEVTSEKANPYKKMEINELALNFYNAGFFNPQMADQALACLQMMDFTKKDEIMQMISKNGTLQEMLLKMEQLSLQLASKYDPAMAEQIGQMMLEQNGSGHMVERAADPSALQNTTDEGASSTDENPMVERARVNARSSTQPE